MKRAAIISGASVTLVVMLAFMAGVGLLSAAGTDGVSVAAPSAKALASIRPEYLALYQRAAATCPGLPWAVLAAIDTIESYHGRSVPPGGDQAAPPDDLAVAAYTAARLLCANGARDGADLPGAIFAYHPADSYVRDVLTLAASYTASGGAEVAVAFALGQLGTPYRWGGEGPGGFDCSGLVQVAFAAAGINLPRTAQQQYDAGPHLTADEPLIPGDLVFFGVSPTDVTHVGIVVSPGQMVDAPHTGAVVRIEPYRRPSLLGATRPAPPAAPG